MYSVSGNEIGSEFWSAPVEEPISTLFSSEVQFYVSGRSALVSIAKELKDCKTVAIPSWCCDSMIKPFIDAGLNVEFYPVSFCEGNTIVSGIKSDVLLILDYFGYADRVAIADDYKGIVIRDVTHTLFTKTYDDADYYFGSLRKWCGVWTGGFAWTRDGHSLQYDEGDGSDYIALRRKAMEEKQEYINGFAESGKAYLDVFSRAEELLDVLPALPASQRDIDLACHLDTDFIKARRRKNADILMSELVNYLLFHEMSETDVPLFVPIILPESIRDKLKLYLIKRDIYCPVHWPLTDYHKLSDEMKKIYGRELSLVCDQRYDENDMYRIVEAVNDFFRENKDC